MLAIRSESFKRNMMSATLGTKLLTLAILLLDISIHSSYAREVSEFVSFKEIDRKN